MCKSPKYVSFYKELSRQLHAAYFFFRYFPITDVIHPLESSVHTTHFPQIRLKDQNIFKDKVNRDPKETNNWTLPIDGSKQWGYQVATDINHRKWYEAWVACLWAIVSVCKTSRTKLCDVSAYSFNSKSTLFTNHLFTDFNKAQWCESFGVCKACHSHKYTYGWNAISETHWSQVNYNLRTR